MRPRRKIPEPTPRVVLAVLVGALVSFGMIIAYDYAIGDPRLAWQPPASANHR